MLVGAILVSTHLHLGNCDEDERSVPDKWVRASARFARPCQGRAMSGPRPHAPATVGPISGPPGRRRASDLEEIVRELRASEARTRELIEFSGDGILVSDAAGRYVEANPAFCRMLGYSGAQLVRLHAGDLAASDDPIGLHGMRDRIGEATGEFGVLVERGIGSAMAR